MVVAALQEHVEASHPLNLPNGLGRARLSVEQRRGSPMEARAGVEPAEGSADPTRAIGIDTSYIFRS